jgi:hypothetical protein
LGPETKRRKPGFDGSRAPVAAPAPCELKREVLNGSRLAAMSALAAAFADVFVSNKFSWWSCSLS